MCPRGQGWPRLREYCDLWCPQCGPCFMRTRHLCHSRVHIPLSLVDCWADCSKPCIKDRSAGFVLTTSAYWTVSLASIHSANTCSSTSCCTRTSLSFILHQNDFRILVFLITRERIDSYFGISPKLPRVVPIRNILENSCVGDDNDLTLWSTSQPFSNPCSPRLERAVFSRVEILLARPVRRELAKVQTRKFRICFQLFASLLQERRLVWVGHST